MSPSLVVGIVISRSTVTGTERILLQRLAPSHRTIASLHRRALCPHSQRAHVRAHHAVSLGAWVLSYPLVQEHRHVTEEEKQGELGWAEGRCGYSYWASH